MTAMPIRFRAAAAALVVAFTTVAFAQTENVETEPITCWWRTDAAGIRVGEQFSVVLTCSVLETQAARALADESRLDPSVVQLAPFEVVSGARSKDSVTAGRRFFQYRYELRLISENVVGRDVALPALQLSYRIESRVQSSESLQGRDLLYVLPALPIRVLSLVPDTATDIQEPPVATFEEIEDRGFRATLLRGLGAVLVLLGAILAALVLVRFARRRAARPAGSVLPDAAILQGVRRELAAVQQESRAGGWDSRLMGRALAALRIAATYASGRPVTQRPATPESAALDGQISMDGRLGREVLVSGNVTAASVAENGNGALRDALARFTAARYGRDGDIDGPALSDALDRSLETVERMSSERTWVKRVWPR
jgi:hypothetical protein